MSDAPAIRFEQADGVLRIVLARPEAANALAPDTRDQIIDRLERAGGDPDVRVVVISAEGKHFCSGADLTAAPTEKNPRASADDAGTITRALRLGSQRLIASILDCEKPVVAEVRGAAAGIGAHIVLACDFVVAADDSRLIEVFAKRALVADGGGAYLLPRLVGLMRAKELMFLADDLSAAEAHRLGIVTTVAPLDDLPAATDALVERLVAAPTRTLALTKWLLNRSLDSSREQAFADEALAQELNMHSDDATEGMTSFIERRPAEYRGR